MENPEKANEKITPNTLVGERRGLKFRRSSGERPLAKLCLHFYWDHINTPSTSAKQVGKCNLNAQDNNIWGSM